MKKTTGNHFFILALYALGAFGIEAVLGMLIEPIIYGRPLDAWSELQRIIHWTITCIAWGLIIFLLAKTSRDTYNFNLFEAKPKLRIWQWLAALFGIALAIGLKYMDWNGLKIALEYQNLGLLLFIFQYVYYAFETALFTLIIVFGQKACELWFKNSRLPYGGIIAGLTWGLGHIFTQGSLLTGIFSMLLGFLFGAMYLLLNRDIKKTYIVLLLMFVL